MTTIFGISINGECTGSLPELTTLTPDTYNSLFWGYNIIFIIIAVYLYFLWKKITSIEHEISKKNNDK